MQRNDENSVNASGVRLSPPKESLDMMGGSGRLISPILFEVPIAEKDKEMYRYSERSPQGSS